MSHSFHAADRKTHRKVMAIGLTLCAIFVAVSFFARRPPQSDAALVKADRITRTAGNPAKAN